MPILTVTPQDGNSISLDAKSGTVLMETLRDAGLIDATCGGAASCGTCHVYFDSAASAGAPTEDEGYMLESLGDFVEIKDGSRLACQVNVIDAHDGMKIDIAPEV